MEKHLLVKRATLHILNTGPSYDPGRGHLHVILTNCNPDQTHLIIPIRSRHPRCDETCLLGAGDHPFLNRESYVSYAQSSVVEAKKLLELLENGDITHRGLLDEKIFARIAIGIEQSRLTPFKIKIYYTSNKSLP